MEDALRQPAGKLLVPAWSWDGSDTRALAQVVRASPISRLLGHLSSGQPGSGEAPSVHQH